MITEAKGTTTAQIVAKQLQCALEEKLKQTNPSATTLDTILRTTSNKRKVNSMKVEYQSIRSKDESQNSDHSKNCNDFNYCQIIMSTSTQVSPEHKLDKNFESIEPISKEHMFDFRRKCEGALLFGVRGVTNLGGMDHYSMDGLIKNISKNTISFRKSEQIDKVLFNISRHVFGGSYGSDRRIIFMGNSVLTHIVEKFSKEKDHSPFQTEIVSGIRFNKYETLFGEFLLRCHPDFTVCGMDNKMLVFDPEDIEFCQLKPVNIHSIDNAANGKERTISYVISEAFTVIVTNPNVHCIVEMID